MASIRRRRWRTAGGEEREVWQVDFVDQAGKRRARQFSRRKAADQFLVSARHAVQVGTYTPEHASATLAEAIQLWLQRCEAEGLERASLRQYRQLAVHVLVLINGQLKLAKLTTARVEQFRDDLLNAHSRVMARKILSALKSALKDAKRRGLVATNPAAETTIGVSGRHKRRLEVGVDVPSPTEVRTLLEAANPKAQAAIALAATAALRISEIRATRWSDLDLGAKPSVTVAQRADRWQRVGSPKSATSRRTVPLGQTAVQALRLWRLAQPPGRTLCFGTASDRPDALDNLRRRLLAPLEASTRVPSYGWHSLRHYAISAWLASGIDLKTVQLWAGHSSLAQTIDTYGHAIPRQDDHQRIAAAERALLAT